MKCSSASKIASIAVAAGLTYGCAAPAIIKDVVDKPVASLDLKASVNSKPIQLNKVVVKLKRGEHIGALQAGLLCVGQGELNWRGGRLNIDSDEFTEAFKEELEKFSFRTVGDTSALFEDPSSWKAEILVAGLVKNLKANICYPMAGFGNFSTSKGEAFVKVDWQIYSKLDRAVVHSVTTEGSYKITESSTGGSESIILNAFTQAARHLLADNKFRGIVVRGGESVKDTTFKTADGIVVTPGKAIKMSSKADEWKDGVVTVYAGRGHGSGFVIGENLVITNHHVVGESKNVIVKFGAGFEVKGEVIAYNSGQDVATVRLQAVLPKYFAMNRNIPSIGAEVFAVGSPLSDQFSSTVTRGIVSAHREENGKKLIQSDVNVRPGNSGGPLLDKDGTVIGITVSGLQINGAGQGINFFIPIGDALDAMSIK
jgi:serine protease Do